MKKFTFILVKANYFFIYFQVHLECEFSQTSFLTFFLWKVGIMCSLQLIDTTREKGLGNATLLASYL